jgi:hypothetical protein
MDKQLGNSLRSDTMGNFTRNYFADMNDKYHIWFTLTYYARHNIGDHPPSPSKKNQIMANFKVWISTCSAQRAEADSEGLQAYFLSAGVLYSNEGRRVGTLISEQITCRLRPILHAHSEATEIPTTSLY